MTPVRASQASSHAPERAPRWLVPLLLIAALTPGCTTMRNALGVGKQLESVHSLGRVDGRIETEVPAEGPLVVVLAKPGETGGAPLVGVDTFVRSGAGSFAFAVEPGRYNLGAYEDRNRNGHLDPGERTLMNRDAPWFEVDSGRVTEQHLFLGRDATTPPDLTHSVDVFGLVERTPQEQIGFSLWALSVQGAICEDVRDRRFGRDTGTLGLWQVMDFLTEGLAGVYFLEPYDPDRVPVLFVHGIGGHPQELLPLIESLDRERFQPWFYLYPSGYALDRIADHLAKLLARLEVVHGFGELAIVAHSMGGLVSRGAILKYANEMDRDDVRLFITLATPWGGHVSAEQAGTAPIALPLSFHDMNPSSDYLRWLFYEDGDRVRPLPDEGAFHMLIGYRMKGRSGVANDGSVTVASQSRLEAQEQAASMRALDVGHVEILSSPTAIDRVNRLLRERFP